MDYLRIGANKLKITMTEEELLFYGMDLSSVSYSSTETRRAFWAILDDAKHATGFDAAASKVSVQIYACRSGGCEMYVIGGEGTPTLSEDADLASHSSETNGESGLTVCPSLPRTFGKAVGKFQKLSDLLSACLALSVSGYDADSSAWQTGDHYYLYLAGNRNFSSTEETPLSASGMISEFGEAVKDLTPEYLSEHCACLCSHNAVERLGTMAR